MPIDDDEYQLKRELISTVGQLAFGSAWPKAMALYLRVSNRHMSRWATKYYEIPDVLPNGEHLIGALRLLLVEHMKDVEDALAKLPAVKEKPEP